MVKLSYSRKKLPARRLIIYILIILFLLLIIIGWKHLAGLI